MTDETNDPLTEEERQDAVPSADEEAAAEDTTDAEPESTDAG